MKWFLILWATPLILLGSWYTLSYHDISFGYFMLSRQANDLIFQIYGNILGLPPETIPPLIARALCVDSLIVFAVMAFRKRAKIIAWVRTRRQARKPESAARSNLTAQRIQPVESALQNEGSSSRIDTFRPLFPGNVHFDKHPFSSNR